MTGARQHDLGRPLGKLEKAIRANRLRRTRFHTERGELLPLAAVPDALRSARTRLSKGGIDDDVPWLCPSAVRALSGLLERDRSDVLELGSGASTLWLAARARTVTSYESLPDWAAQVRERIAQRSVENVELREVAIDELPAKLAELARSFDVVLVDCLESEAVKRVDLLGPASRVVRPGGCIVLDDSDRAHLRAAPAELPGWRVERHVGIKPFPLMAIETTLFRRPPAPS